VHVHGEQVLLSTPPENVEADMPSQPIGHSASPACVIQSTPSASLSFRIQDSPASHLSEVPTILHNCTAALHLGVGKTAPPYALQIPKLSEWDGIVTVHEPSLFWLGTSGMLMQNPIDSIAVKSGVPAQELLS